MHADRIGRHRVVLGSAKSWVHEVRKPSIRKPYVQASSREKGTAAPHSNILQTPKRTHATSGDRMECSSSEAARRHARELTESRYMMAQCAALEILETRERSSQDMDPGVINSWSIHCQ